MNNDIFKTAYLAQLGLIKEDVDMPAAEGPAPEEIEMKEICFKTTDAALIDALNSGFEEVVFFVNAKDEATGEDTVVEVKFGKDSFGDLVITDVEEEDDEEIDECNEIKEEDEEYEEEDEEDIIEEEDDEEIEDNEISEMLDINISDNNVDLDAQDNELSLSATPLP
jgi:hypothetical protein